MHLVVITVEYFDSICNSFKSCNCWNIGPVVDYSFIHSFKNLYSAPSR